ncbi:heavy metal translocating P-type ATPase [Cloacibacterium sp.]|uniref:heavy metal translocating P-type ATPase n=1 Tax=Cloacibacterium sp. TaxID=1913682 RepID=UPI0039E65C52
MNTKKYNVLGMSCEGCQKKISTALNNIEGIKAEINLAESSVEISSDSKIDLEKLNSELKNAGNYVLEDPEKPKSTTFIPPQDRVSPSSVYYCPMECEGDKVYFTQGKRCPVCNMYCVPIEEKKLVDSYQLSVDSKHKTINYQLSTNNQGRYYCPMFCEGDKTYPENVGCPVCGMDLVKITGTDDDSEDDTYKNLRKKLWISVVFTVPILILSMGGMFFEFPFSSKISGFLQLLFTLPVVFFTGWFLFKRAWISFKTWNLNMFSLIGLGASAAFVYSIFALFFPSLIPHEFMQNHHEVPLYFEAVAIILTLVIFGQMLEAKAHQRTGSAIKELMNLSPKEAHLIINNSEKNIPIAEVKIGDILRVKPGEKIPVDGEITEGNTTIDESMITGEPIPAEKKLGDKVTSGTINGNQVFLMKTEKIGSDTLLSQIIEMVNSASRSKAPIQKLTDKVSKIFVPVVIAISVLTFVLWYFLGGENRAIFALVNALAVLIVACPCALGLATPMSVMVGIGKGAKNGILIKNAEALEEMQKVNVIITDKTGTLTEGKPSLTQIFAENIAENEALQFAAALNKNSEHPLSQAVLNKAKFFDSAQNDNLKEVKNFENISGRGILGEIEGKKIFLGNIHYLKENNFEISENILQKAQILENEANTISYLTINGKAVAVFGFKDQIKENAKSAIDFLHQKGIEVIMMTGDNEATAKHVAESLGIKNYFANCLPQDKINEVKKLQKQGKIVAMTGDGINDAPALAQANVGIAMGTGTDIAMNSAEITLLKGDISGVAKSKILSEKMMKNVKENLFFAFAYNTLGIPIAAGLLYPIFGVLLSPMFAAAAMSFSSVSVIANSLRLNSIKLKI